MVGNHVPVIPFGEVVANAGAVLPEHKEPIAGKFGLTIGFTVTERVTGVLETHCPVSGV